MERTDQDTFAEVADRALAAYKERDVISQEISAFRSAHPRITNEGFPAFERLEDAQHYAFLSENKDAAYQSMCEAAWELHELGLPEKIWIRHGDHALRITRSGRTAQLFVRKWPTA